jgi:tetratricopeptide (TPR) repeat protein
MMNNPFRFNNLTTKRKEQMNEDLSFPIAALELAKKANEVLVQYTNGFSTERIEQTNEDLSFPIAAHALAKKADEVFPQSIDGLVAETKEETNENLPFPTADLEPAKKTDEVFPQSIDGLTAETKEETNEDLPFPTVDIPHAEKVDKVFLQQINFFSVEKIEQTNEDLRFPIAALTPESKVDEISEQQIPIENESHIDTISEDTISEDSSEETADFPSYTPQQDSLHESEEEPLLTLGEETDEEGNKGEQFEGLSIGEEDISSVSAEETLNQDQDELYSYRAERINDEKNDVRYEEPKKEETSTTITDEEMLRSFKEKKARAVALAEENRENRKTAFKQVLMNRKKYILWLGLGFVSVCTLTVASVLYFYSEKIDPMKDFDPLVYISDSADKNVHNLELKAQVSDDSNSFVSGNEMSKDVVVYNNGKISDGVVSSDLRLITSGANYEKSPFVSEDNINQNVAQNIIPPESVETRIIFVDNTENKGKSVPKDTKNEVRITTSELRKTTSRTSITASETRKATSETRTTVVIPAKANGEPTAKVERKYTGSFVKSTGKRSPIDMNLTQDKTFSAIRDERYLEAINLSKSNLEKNPKDRLSFFFLGVAFYASSDYSGATKAFYACLGLDGPALPDFRVEEFDSTASLEKLFVNYPGVGSLIQSVELNPQDKSLYLNLFLSNLKSEKPKDTSEIYYAILNHAQKHGLN